MTTAFLINCVVSSLFFGGYLFFFTGRGDRLLICACVIAMLPVSYLAFHFVRLPLDERIGAIFGGAGYVYWLQTGYAPLIEEPAKLWVLLIPQIRKAINPANVGVVALAIGLGFALGEAWTVADLIYKRAPEIACLPWYMLGGYIMERFMTCSIHGGLVAISLTFFTRGSGIYFGLPLAMIAHYLVNFPISAAALGWLGGDADTSKGILFIWTLACFIAASMWLVWLSFSSVAFPPRRK